MTPDRLREVNRLRDKIVKVEREIKIWENEIKSPEGLAYKQSSNSDHPVDLKSNISPETFSFFRAGVLENLRTILAAAEQEFEEV